MRSVGASVSFVSPFGQLYAPTGWFARRTLFPRFEIKGARLQGAGCTLACRRLETASAFPCAGVLRESLLDVGDNLLAVEAAVLDENFVGVAAGKNDASQINAGHVAFKCLGV